MTALSKKGRAVLRTCAVTAAAFCLFATAACSSPEQRVERYTKSGEQYLADGDLGRANVQFQNALKINEEYVPALEGVADLTERKQDFRGMFGVLQRILRLDPNNVDARVKIGKLYLIGSDESSALEAAEKALELKPDDPDALALKGAVLLKLDDTTGAVELARRALELDPENPEAVTILVTERSRAGDNKAALAELDKALAAEPETPVLYLLRLRILDNLGRTQDMLAGYVDLIERFPDVVGYRQLYVRALLQENKLAESKEQLTEIVRLSPGKIEPMLDVVRLEYRLNGEAAARKQFEDFVEASPDNVDLKFAFARFLREQGDYEQAEGIYDAFARTKSPEGVALRAKNELAAMLLMQGKKEEAQALVTEILEKDGSNTDALLKRAGLKIDAGDYDSAIADLRSTLNNNPDSTPAKLLMAAAFERKGDIDFARTQMAQAVSESENAAGPSNTFAKFLIRHGDAARAEKVLTDSLGRAPGNLDNLKLLAAVQLMQQNWRGAEDTAKLIEDVSVEEPVVNRILGAAYAGSGDYGSAIDALAAENERAPLGARPLATLISSYVRDGRADEAEKLLRSMIESDPTKYEARLLLAQTFEAEGNSDEMTQTLRDAIDASPDRGEARESLYRIYVRSGRLDEAEALIDDGLARMPNNDGLKVLQADLYLTTDRKDEAISLYEEILTRRPKDPLVSNNYASLLLETRDDRQSRSRALEVAEALKDSQNPYFLDTYGWALYKNGEFERAVAALEKAAESAPGMTEIAYHLGAAYLASGATEKGRNVLQEVADGGDKGFATEARALLAENRE